MESTFKVGDKVKVTRCPFPAYVGVIGEVTKLGGTREFGFEKDGVVLTSDDFNDPLQSMHGEHNVWFTNSWLEKVE